MESKSLDKTAFIASKQKCSENGQVLWTSCYVVCIYGAVDLKP